MSRLPSSTTINIWFRKCLQYVMNNKKNILALILLIHNIEQIINIFVSIEANLIIFNILYHNVRFRIPDRDYKILVVVCFIGISTCFYLWELFLIRFFLALPVIIMIGSVIGTNTKYRSYFSEVHWFYKETHGRTFIPAPISFLILFYFLFNNEFAKKHFPEMGLTLSEVQLIVKTNSTVLSYEKSNDALDYGVGRLLKYGECKYDVAKELAASIGLDPRHKLNYVDFHKLSRYDTYKYSNACFSYVFVAEIDQEFHPSGNNKMKMIVPSNYELVNGTIIVNDIIEHYILGSWTENINLFLDI